MSEKPSNLPDGVPEIMWTIVEKLVRIHGPGRISHEEGGLHLNLASPKCLKEDGLRELQPSQRHLSINLDKVFRLGPYANEKRGKTDKAKLRDRGCAQCMKHSLAYSISDLLSMKTVEERGYTVKDRKLTTQAPARLIDDGRGNMIPDHPGVVTPVVLLPPAHPARVYLESRGFSAREAWDFCRAAYCVTAAPEGEAYSRFYRRMAGATKNSPEGRLILYIDIEGVQRGWQARYLERTTKHPDGSRSLFHWISMSGNPYDWVEVARRGPEEKEWEYRPELQHPDFPYSPAKYLNAVGQKRNETLMGLDKAVAWNTAAGRSHRLAVSVEGPTDALRLYGAGLPAIAVMGKHLSDAQADALASRFDVVAIVPDNDRAGAELQAKLVTKLTDRRVRIVSVPIPKEFGLKDAGDLTREQAALFAKEVHRAVDALNLQTCSSGWGDYNHG